LALLDRLAEFSSAPRVAELRGAIAGDMQPGFGGVNRHDATVPKVAMPRRTIAMPLTARETVFVAHDDLPFGRGWFHVFPRDTWRWTMAPEARMVFEISGSALDAGVQGPGVHGPGVHATKDAVPTAADITIRLNRPAWAVCYAQHLDVLCNGQLVGRITKESADLTVTVPLGDRTRTLDVRVRGSAADVPASDPRSLVFNRIVAPVEEIRISLSSR
jgi:hypothetical protein